MSKTNTKKPPLVQYFEKVVDREYSILRKGLIFSYRDVVRVDKIKSELILEIKTEETPHTVLVNGVEYVHK